eukprot:4403677-Pyramimonas_sp.AAC.1
MADRHTHMHSGRLAKNAARQWGGRPLRSYAGRAQLPTGEHADMHIGRHGDMAIGRYVDKAAIRQSYVGRYAAGAI